MQLSKETLNENQYGKPQLLTDNIYNKNYKMKISFDNLFEHIISMNHFRLKWRFTENMYHKLTDEHLDQLNPLDSEAAQFLWEYLASTKLHEDTPFKKDFFRNIDKAKILDGNDNEIKSGFINGRFLLKNLFCFPGNPQKQ